MTTTPDPSDAERPASIDGPRDPVAFARALREGEARRVGSLPADRNEAIRSMIREEFGEPPTSSEDRPRSIDRRVLPSSGWQRFRAALSPLAAVAAVAFLFFLVRDWFIPGDAAPLDGEVAPSTAPPAPSPPIAAQSIETRLIVACAARQGRRFEGLDASLASLVVGLETPIAVVSADLKDLDLSSLGVGPVEATLVPPADLDAAFGTWQVRIELPPDAFIEGAAALVGWRIAIDLGDLEVVAIGDSTLAGFTSPPAHDAATIAGGRLVLAAVAPKPVAVDGPVVVARVQARRLVSAGGSAPELPAPMEGGSFAAVDLGGMAGSSGAASDPGAAP